MGLVVLLEDESMIEIRQLKESNGLWVYPDQRNRGISLMMIIYTLDFYMVMGMEKIVVYNHHYASSNQFYHKFCGQVTKQEYQMEDKLLVDIFLTDILSMKSRMEQSLKKYIGEYA